MENLTRTFHSSNISHKNTTVNTFTSFCRFSRPNRNPTTLQLYYASSSSTSRQPPKKIQKNRQCLHWFLPLFAHHTNSADILSLLPFSFTNVLQIPHIAQKNRQCLHFFSPLFAPHPKTKSSYFFYPLHSAAPSKLHTANTDISSVSPLLPAARRAPTEIQNILPFFSFPCHQQLTNPT